MSIYLIEFYNFVSKSLPISDTIWNCCMNADKIEKLQRCTPQIIMPSDSSIKVLVELADTLELRCVRHILTLVTEEIFLLKF